MVRLCQNILSLSLTHLTIELQLWRVSPNCQQPATKKQTLSVETSQNNKALIAQAHQPGLTATPDIYCFYHKRRSHARNECDQLQKLSFQERKDFLMKNRICFNCIKTNKHTPKVATETNQRVRSVITRMSPYYTT